MPARPGLAMPSTRDARPAVPPAVDYFTEDEMARLVRIGLRLLVSAAKNRAARAAAPDADGPSSVPRTTAPTAAR